LEFECDCGKGTFINSTDNRAYVAHLIPDEEYDAFSDVVDAAIERSGPTPYEKGAACMAWRKFRMPKAWQCYVCGSFYVEDKYGQRHCFRPDTAGVSKHLFKRKEA
jgi:hypothetical protein